MTLSDDIIMKQHEQLVRLDFTFLFHYVITGAFHVYAMIWHIL